VKCAGVLFVSNFLNAEWLYKEKMITKPWAY